LGQLTFSTPIQLIDLKQGLSIELYPFPSGVYTVVVLGKFIRGTGKIIKIND
jgi:GH24 family phage-related lysozyme (muramidase)